MFSFPFAYNSAIEFLKYKTKSKRNGKDYIFPEITKKYDLIIIAEIGRLGGNTELTKALKIHTSNCLEENGLSIWKSYFYPALESNINILKNKKIIGITLLNMSFLDKKIIAYRDRDKINLISSFSKNI